MRSRDTLLCLRDSFFASYAFVVITLPDSPMALHKEKFSLSAASAIVSYSCGLAEAQSFCTCVGKERSRLPVSIGRL